MIDFARVDLSRVDLLKVDRSRADESRDRRDLCDSDRDCVCHE